MGGAQAVWLMQHFPRLVSLVVAVPGLRPPSPAVVHCCCPLPRRPRNAPSNRPCPSHFIHTHTELTLLCRHPFVQALDFGDVVVHVFTPDQRAYYDLDSFYATAEEVDWKSDAPADAQQQQQPRAGQPPAQPRWTT